MKGELTSPGPRHADYDLKCPELADVALIFIAMVNLPEGAFGKAGGRAGILATGSEAVANAFENAK